MQTFGREGGLTTAPGGSGRGGLDEGWTRAELLRRAAGGGVGLFLLGSGGSIAYQLLEADSVAAATRATGANAGVRTFASRPDLQPPIVEVVHAAQDTADGYLFITPSSGPGPARRADARRRRRGRLVPPDHPADGDELPCSDLQGRARAHVVGRQVEERPRRRRVRDRRPVVSRGRALRGRRSSPCRPPRVHHHAARTPRSSRSNEIADDGPDERRRPVALARRRRRRPGARDPERARPLRVAQPRPCGRRRSRTSQIGPQFDYFHVNSIDVDADGNLLVSARNTWAVYKVNRKTGDVMWRLGGKKSDFAMGDGTVFAWQHDARHPRGRQARQHLRRRRRSEGRAAVARARASRSTLSRMRATLERKYTHSPSLLAKYTGSAQLLANGDMLVGWGSEPYFTEFGRRRRRPLRREAAEGRPDLPCAALPVGGPAVPAAERSSRARRWPAPVLYASWNGATEVASWQLQTGKGAAALETALTKPRHGFETALPAASDVSRAAVVALDASGKPLGRSATIAV